MIQQGPLRLLLSFLGPKDSFTEYIMRIARLDAPQVESRFLGEISIISDMQIIPLLGQKVKRN